MDSLLPSIFWEKGLVLVMLSKFVHGWLPTGAIRALTTKGSYECPHCGPYKSTENLLMCHPPNIKFTRERRLTQFSSQMNQLKYGKTITPILVHYLTYVLHNLDGLLQRKLQSGYNRGRKTANQSGVKSTTPNRQNSDSLGIFSNRWGSSAILEESEERTVAMAHKWTATASMMQTWALATTPASMGARTEANNVLHNNEKNQRIVVSAMDERIMVLYNKQDEICIRDNHQIKHPLKKLLASRD